MINFERKTDNTCSFNIDHNIYSDIVISKTLYCFSDEYIISRKMINSDMENIVLESIKNNLSDVECYNLRNKLSQRLTDYKLRSIIATETENIRDILYIKAFANSDDFEDYNLID